MKGRILIKINCFENVLGNKYKAAATLIYLLPVGKFDILSIKPLFVIIPNDLFQCSQLVEERRNAFGS